MIKVTPQLVVNLFKTFPQAARDAVERDLLTLTTPPYVDINCQLRCSGAVAPMGLLEYALRFGGLASVELLLEAGADPNAGQPRLLTVLTMAQICRDDGRIEKMEALLKAGAQADYVEAGGTVPPTPLIALARSKIGGIQRYWLGRLLCAAGATVRTTNDYESRVMARLLAELRAIDGIMEYLSPDEQAATKATPSSLSGLIAAVMHSGQPAAFDQIIMVKKELRLPLDFDATAALRAMAMRIADQPVSSAQAGFVRKLLDSGAEMMTPPGRDSAFELALANENHELVEIFLEAGAKPNLASAPELVFELMRRQGLPQRPKLWAAKPEPLPPSKALNSLDLLCSGIEGLEACPEADLNRLTADHTAALQSLAERLHAMVNRLAPDAGNSAHR
jgi:hypothetical protein